MVQDYLSYSFGWPSHGAFFGIPQWSVSAARVPLDPHREPSKAVVRERFSTCREYLDRFSFHKRKGYSIGILDEAWVGPEGQPRGNGGIEGMASNLVPCCSGLLVEKSVF